jgi:hypothetical protein
VAFSSRPAPGSLEGKHGKAGEKARKPTDDWEQLELLCEWEEQREYVSVTNPRLLTIKYRTSQLKLFALDDSSAKMAG